MKKILVTGHKGFIGQNLCKAIHEQGWGLTTFDIVDNPSLRPSDLELKDVDCIVHLGAISSTTETDVRKIMDLNLSWSIELLEECIDKRIHMQFASSASVYGNRYRRPIKETDACSPLNYYAKSKFLFEQYLSQTFHTNVVQVFRYFNVYGPHEEHKGSQASPYTQFAKQAKETGVIKVFEGSEKYFRDFVHVDKVVEAHIRSIKQMNEFSSGTFNVGSGYARSFMDVARDIALLYNARIETIPFPDHLKIHYQYYTEADISKLKSELFYG